MACCIAQVLGTGTGSAGLQLVPAAAAVVAVVAVGGIACIGDSGAPSPSVGGDGAVEAGLDAGGAESAGASEKTNPTESAHK